MNEELQGALAPIIDTVVEGKDFILEQAPDVIHQLLAWMALQSGLWFVGGVIFLIFGIKTSIELFKWAFIEKNDEEGLFSVIGIMICLAVPLMVCGHNLAWLQIWIAPKVYLLEYASQLIK